MLQNRDLISRPDFLRARAGKLDIIADILKVANKGSKKTKLVYKTNTNFVLMKEYLELLEKRGLILEYNATVYTTDAGNEYLLRAPPTTTACARVKRARVGGREW